MTEPWRSLRIDDRIRITYILNEFLHPGYTFPDETRTLYEHLIAHGEILIVDDSTERLVTA